MKFRKFWKKKSILAWLLPKLLHPKEIFTEACERSCFSTRFLSQRVNDFETLLKLAPRYYFSIFQWIRDKLSLKKSALVTSEILRLFVKTFTPDEEYSRRNMRIFWQQLQTPLFQKGKTCFGFLIAFLKCAWNLEHCEKKEKYPCLIITEIIEFERDIYLIVQKVLLQHTFR